jgi:hypothetical protein
MSAPPGRRSGPDVTPDRSNVEVAATATAASVPQQLARRRDVSRRLSRLTHCGADPWLADQRRWRDEWDVAMAQRGEAPEWQRQRARGLWEAGVR